MPIQNPRIPAVLELVRLAGFAAHGQSIHSARIAEESLDSLRLEDFVLEASMCEKLRLEAAHWIRADLRDVKIEQSDLSNAIWSTGSAHRVEIADSRLTGFAAPESAFRDVIFNSCKMNLCGFRFAKMENAAFIECDLRGADFFSAALKAVRFERCDLSESSFERCTMTAVDFRSSGLVGLKSVEGLSGSIIDSVQMIDLGPQMAQFCGIQVLDAQDPTLSRD